MLIKEIIFSPTGGTKAVADILARTLGEPPFTIDLANRFADHEQIALSDNDVAVIAMPCYCGRVPKLAAERFARVRGHGARAILVAVYGNRAIDDQLVEMADLAKASGFQVVAAVEAIAEHSIVRQYAAGRPDAQDAVNLSRMAQQITEKLVRNDLSEPALPGNRPYKEGACGGYIPRASHACVYCGECAESCPAGAIDPAKLEASDPTRCISCMRCIVRCPVGARAIDPSQKAKVSEHLREVASIRKEAALYL